MSSKWIGFFALVVVNFSACKKMETDQAGALSTIDVSKQWVLDPSGFVITSQYDGQWQAKSFTQQELDLFSVLDTANLSGTNKPTEVLEIAPNYNSLYPNPFINVQALSMRFTTGFTGYIVLKAVIVDNLLNPYFTLSKKLAITNANFSIAILPPIPSGNYRFYFTLSSQNNPHFYKCWGNIQKN